ncbi:hypothetical protein HDU97_007194 [Phlyctochytrium planicorne]|nr:hypothetical protein HDU97_007194 [Phlyctochytrium planicorne]
MEDIMIQRGLLVFSLEHLQAKKFFFLFNTEGAMNGGLWRPEGPPGAFPDQSMAVFGPNNARIAAPLPKEASSSTNVPAAAFVQNASAQHHIRLPNGTSADKASKSSEEKDADWIVSKVIEYDKLRKEHNPGRPLEALGQSLVTQMSQTGASTKVPSTITVSNPMGIHFGTFGPKSPPVIKELTIKGPPRSFLRCFFLLPKSDDFSLKINAPPPIAAGWSIEKEVSLSITSESAATFGLHSAWIVVLIDLKPVNGSKLDRTSYVVFRPLVKIITDMSVSKFVFDIYSKPFVPKYLIDINLAPGYVLSGERPRGPNYFLHLQSWLPPSLMDATPASDLAPVHPIFDTSQMTLPPLNLPAYCERLRTLLRIEYGARLHELAKSSMYTVTIQGDSNMWRIEVPGMVDDNPRLRIGDVLRLRRIPFDGYEHEAFIFGTLRRMRSIYFKSPLLSIQPGDTFNIQFLLDESPIKSTSKAIGLLQRWLADTKHQFGRKVLFPDVEDGKFTQMSDAALPEDVTFRDDLLNTSQQRAVQSVLEQKYGQVPFLIWGPPGTGKTKTCIEIIYQLIQKNQNFRILACAPSSSAADTITRRLKVFLAPKQLIRLISSVRAPNEVPDELLPFTISREGHFDLPSLHDIMQARVIVCNCEEAEMLALAGLTNEFTTDAFTRYHQQQESISPFFHRTKVVLEYPLWTHLLIDEAGQASEADTAVPLSVVANGLAKMESPANDYFVPIILSGDHMQLGPLVQSSFARHHKMDVSLFERIIGRQLYKDHPEFRDAPLKTPEAAHPDTPSLILKDMRAPFVNLIRNYRSHPSMITIPSRLFYNNTLIPYADVKVTHSLKGISILPNPDVPIVFVGVNGIDERAGDEGASWWNGIEAAKVMEMIESIVKVQGVELKDFGVISPFREQVKRLRELMRARGLGAIDVGTVEDYQGMERRIIVLSCVRSRSRFLIEDIRGNVGVVNFPQRLNVALTRAMSLLVIVGNPAILALDPHWISNIHFYVKNECYTGCPLPHQLTASPDDALPPAPVIPVNPRVHMVNPLGSKPLPKPKAGTDAEPFAAPGLKKSRPKSTPSVPPGIGVSPPQIGHGNDRRLSMGVRPAYPQAPNPKRASLPYNTNEFPPPGMPIQHLGMPNMPPPMQMPMMEMGMGMEMGGIPPGFTANLPAFFQTGPPMPLSAGNTPPPMTPPGLVFQRPLEPFGQGARMPPVDTTGYLENAADEDMLKLEGEDEYDEMSRMTFGEEWLDRVLEMEEN